MHIEVCWIDTSLWRCWCCLLCLPVSANVADAIKSSGVDRSPHWPITGDDQKDYPVWRGRNRCKPDDVLRDGDRLSIVPPLTITATPKGRK